MMIDGPHKDIVHSNDGRRHVSNGDRCRLAIHRGGQLLNDANEDGWRGEEQRKSTTAGLTCSSVMPVS